MRRRKEEGKRVRTDATIQFFFFFSNCTRLLESDFLWHLVTFLSTLAQTGNTEIATHTIDIYFTLVRKANGNSIPDHFLRLKVSGSVFPV